MLIEQRHVESCIGPIIRTKRDLTNLCEVEDYETGAFKRTTFTYVDDNDVAWFGQTPDIRKYDLTVEDLNRLLQRIPDEKIYPRRTSSISTISDTDRQNYFIKRPKLLCLDNDEETKLLPQILLEAEVLEFLKPHHHPNLIRFHGCTVNRGRFTGIALDKHKVILQNHYKKVICDLDIVACMDGIRAGVRHLHSLGLAHNDLNPMNIALDGDDQPIILDFGSCKRFGEQLISEARMAG
jgi:serine/threonine protein kinase